MEGFLVRHVDLICRNSDEVRKLLGKCSFGRAFKMQMRSFETFEEYKMRVLKRVEQEIDKEIRRSKLKALGNIDVVFSIKLKDRNRALLK